VQLFFIIQKKCFKITEEKLALGGNQRSHILLNQGRTNKNVIVKVIIQQSNILK